MVFVRYRRIYWTLVMPPAKSCKWDSNCPAELTGLIDRLPDLVHATLSVQRRSTITQSSTAFNLSRLALPLVLVALSSCHHERTREYRLGRRMAEPALRHQCCHRRLYNPPPALIAEHC